MREIRPVDAVRSACTPPRARALAPGSSTRAQRAGCRAVLPERPGGEGSEPAVRWAAQAGRDDRRRALLAGRERPDQAGSVRRPAMSGGLHRRTDRLAFP
ncbi:hypothetical protein GCM10010129_44230 [Streptomyces fumigatiscleroticus]|nr:hypothetical protein GCM10010129_44230 [Streptomyces fumigatiscleroticus]